MSATATSTPPSDRPARDGQPAALRHGVAGVADQVGEDDPDLVDVAQHRRQRRRDSRRVTWIVLRQRVGLQRLAHALLDRERPQVGHRHLGEVRQGRDDAVGQHDVPLDALQVLGRLLRRRIAGVEQVVDRGLDDVERVAQLVGDAAGDLADGRQPLAALLPGRCTRPGRRPR